MFTQKFRDMPLKRKIELIILGCVFFLSATAFLSIYCISRSHDKVLYRSVAANLSYAASEIHSDLLEVNELADMIFSNDTVQRQLPAAMSTDSREKKQSIETTVYNVLTNYMFNTANQHISYITILQEESTICTYLVRFRKVPSEIRDDLVKRGNEAQGSTVWITDYSQDYGLFLVKELREAKDFSFRHMGTLIINVNPDTLIGQTSIFRSAYETPSLLLLEDGKTIYSSQELPQREISRLTSSLEKNYTITEVMDQTLFAVKGYIPDYDWDYIAMVSYESIAWTVSLTTTICIGAMLLCAGTVLLLSARILAALTRHFDWLVKKMHLVGEGTYQFPANPYDYSQRKDEIGQLHTNFDSMAHKINTLITENYTNELLKKEAQLKSLESQMDPHFLYNTLDSIHWRANAVGAEDISQITTSLGYLLRMSLSKSSEPFTLRQELELVENYMAIQKLRYSQRLIYEMQIPKEYQNLLLPKFTIQPLLENAIRYGLDNSSDVCTITVSAVLSEDLLVIEVKNSGSSFEENLLEKLVNQEILPHGFGIGLLNIHQRIQIAYGDHFGLHLKNIEEEETGEEYAVVQVFLPVLPQQENVERT
ncbi:MAG TPA: sensor histidine kinase [Candidatus Blautia merdavium]|uniref:Sensor histidine kinase n=1 Tax=Candidatus Blautia merdavium TaxID=2838494 RepID=A0A9D2PP77_9FIRM|nr:sensor histidine kinase [Candidatus Blautia merdavium]